MNLLLYKYYFFYLTITSFLGKYKEMSRMTNLSRNLTWKTKIFTYAIYDLNLDSFINKIKAALVKIKSDFGFQDYIFLNASLPSFHFHLVFPPNITSFYKNIPNVRIINNLN